MRWLAGIALAVVIALTGGTSTALAEKKCEHHHHHCMMHSTVHRGMYMQLLADRYATETSAAWKQVFMEREQLLQQMRDMRDERKKEAKKKLGEKKLPKDGKRSEGMKERKQLYEFFTAAVKNGDEQQIKSVLPKLLASEQAKNDKIKQWIAKGKSR